MKKYDLIIIGAGPAGLTAGIYAGRYLLKTLILGKLPGGTITEAHKVCNFPSQKEVTGIKLAMKIIEQAKSLDVEIKQENVKEIKKENKFFKIKTNKESYSAKKIILSSGRKKEKLNIPGEEEFLGKGVSYCATCDAAFYKNKIVSVVGGSNAALTASLLLSEYAKKVYIIYRKDKFFRPEASWVKQVEKNKKIKKIFNTNIIKISGKEKVEKIELDSGEEIKVDGVFIEIGSTPHKDIPKQLGLKTEKDYIIVNKKQETNIKGVYASGDITNNPLKQVITACAEGAIASNSAYQDIKKEEKN
ncbi:MAG: FAD-dependent oxidoreductase [Nanoarchaeota archaeon]